MHAGLRLQTVAARTFVAAVRHMMLRCNIISDSFPGGGALR